MTISFNKALTGVESAEISAEMVEQLSAYLLCQLQETTHLKLQKLLYYTCALYYAISEEEQHINNGPEIEFQAWVHGPVNRHLYNLCDEEYNRHDLIKYSNSKIEELKHFDDLTPESKEFIDQILNIYGDLSGARLETLTHSEKPWKEQRVGVPEYAPSNAVISYETIRDYYRELLSI